MSKKVGVYHGNKIIPILNWITIQLLKAHWYGVNIAPILQIQTALWQSDLVPPALGKSERGGGADPSDSTLTSEDSGFTRTTTSFFFFLGLLLNRWNRPYDFFPGMFEGHRRRKEVKTRQWHNGNSCTNKSQEICSRYEITSLQTVDERRNEQNSCCSDFIVTYLRLLCFHGNQGPSPASHSTLVYFFTVQDAIFLTHTKSSQ